MGLEGVYFNRLMGNPYETQNADFPEQVVHSVLVEAESGSPNALVNSIEQLPLNRNRCVVLMAASEMLGKLKHKSQNPDSLQGKIKLINGELDATLQLLKIPKLAFFRDFYREKMKYEKSLEAVVPQRTYPFPLINPYKFRTEIFSETLQACKRGYLNSKGKVVKIDSGPMIRESETYAAVKHLPKATVSYATRFSVITEDTYQVMLKRKAEGGKPVGVNMAHREHAGGGVVEGCPAQEEALCRASDLYLGLTSQPYPFHEMGGNYIPHVNVFRKSNHEFLDEPQQVAMVSIAAYDLREGAPDRLVLGLPLRGKVDPEKLKSNSRYIEGMTQKVRNMLLKMAEKGHTEIVLGAIGCGAFENPPDLVAAIFKKVLSEDGLLGRFKRVDFAILKIFPNDQRNVDAFGKICDDLNPK